MFLVGGEEYYAVVRHSRQIFRFRSPKVTHREWEKARLARAPLSQPHFCDTIGLAQTAFPHGTQATTRHSTAGRDSSGSRGQIVDAVHGITFHDGLEIGQRRANGEREVPPSAGGDADVLAENRRPLLRRRRDEANGTPASLPDDGVAVRSFDVFHPIGIRPQHGDQVIFAIHRGDHHGV